MLSGEQRARWFEEAGVPQLDQILFWRWDPIGVADELPYTDGEYHDYARGLASKLLDGASRDEVTDYLMMVERDAMGIRPRRRRARAVADQVVDWFPKSVGHWLEFRAGPPRETLPP